MEAQLAGNLRQLTSSFAAARSIEVVTVAQRALGDWQFFERIDAGASFTVRKYDKALAWFSTNWPANVDWPDDVARPSIAPEAEAVA